MKAEIDKDTMKYEIINLIREITGRYIKSSFELLFFITI
jgi:hypothetical protein